MSTESEKNRWRNLAWIAIITSIIWWSVAGQWSLRRTVLLVAISLASFMVGCVVGFLFTSYGEEASTLGKIRDGLIGGILALTITKTSAITATLAVFAAGPGPSEFAYVASAATVYFAFGFFLMFFGRELGVNVMLARSRAERARFEGTGQAGQITQRISLALPASILSGVDDVDEIVQFRKSEAEKLRTLIYSSDVQKFLDDAADALKTGANLDWDVVSKVASLQYYRTYFEKEEDKFCQAECASTWIVRALTMNPLHVDFTVKYADTLSMMERYEEAVAVLERLDRTPEAPAYIKQWLGFFCLFVDREDDAIRYSEEYHKLFPTESDSVFNMASAYAQKYCAELRTSGKTQDRDSENRRQALDKLKEALRGEPDYVETVRNKWTQSGASFDCFLHDPDFRSLVDLPPEAFTNTTRA